MPGLVQHLQVTTYHAHTGHHSLCPLPTAMSAKLRSQTEWVTPPKSRRPLYHLSSPSPIPYLPQSLGHHRWLYNQIPPFFSVLHYHLGLYEFQACPFLDAVFPFLFLSAFSSSSFHCALQDGFCQTWWTGDMSIPPQSASLYNGQEVFMRSDCLLDLGTDLLICKIVFGWDLWYLAVALHFHHCIPSSIPLLRLSGIEGLDQTSLGQGRRWNTETGVTIRAWHEGLQKLRPFLICANSVASSGVTHILMKQFLLCTNSIASSVVIPIFIHLCIIKVRSKTMYEYAVMEGDGDDSLWCYGDPLQFVTAWMAVDHACCHNYSGINQIQELQHLWCWSSTVSYTHLTLRRDVLCRSRWSPYH